MEILADQPILEKDILSRVQNPLFFLPGNYRPEPVVALPEPCRNCEFFTNTEQYQNRAPRKTGTPQLIFLIIQIQQRSSLQNLLGRDSWSSPSARLTTGEVLRQVHGCTCLTPSPTTCWRGICKSLSSSDHLSGH